MKKNSLFISMMLIAILAFSSCGIEIEKVSENKTTDSGTATTQEISSEEAISESENTEEITGTSEESVQELEIVSTIDLLKENPVQMAFMSIEIDMEKSKVDEILGEGLAREKDPFDTSVDPFEYDVEGVPVWVNFKDGKVVRKSTKENKDWAVAISKENFAKAKEGMTYDEIKSIFGEGQLNLEAKSASSHTKQYFWNIKSGYQSITISFKDGLASRISNMNMN